MSENVADPKDIFKNFDIDKGTYKIGKLELKFKEISVSEYEALQDKEAEMRDLQGEETTAKEALKLEREWNEYVLKTAFGKDVDIKAIKKECNASKYQTTIAEVVIFLVKFSGMEGLRDFIKASTVKQD